MIERVIVDSARQHPASDETILHAFNKLVRSEDLGDDLVMLIGSDQAGNLYEIGVVVTEDGRMIVRAMPARPKYLR